VPKPLDDSQRASEILALNEILKRRRPDLRFVPLESLIGLVVRNGNRKEPVRLRRLFQSVAKETSVPREDFPQLALELMVDMPPEDLAPDANLERLLQLRTGFSLTGLIPGPVGAAGRLGTSQLARAAQAVGVERGTFLACIAASPFIGRAVIATDPRIRAGGLAAAIACGVAVGEPF